MNVKELNYGLYKAAEHLSEAGKHLMVLDPKRGIELMQEAEAILSIIQPVAEKIEPEKLNSVLDEILNINLEA